MLRTAKLVALAAAIIISVEIGVAVAASNSGAQPITLYTRELAQAQGKDKAAALLRRAEERGRVRIIIGLAAEMAFEDEITSAQQRRQVAALRNVQAAVRARSMIPADQVTTFDTIPYMSAFVTAAQLRRVLRDPQVLSIQEDIPLKPLLDESVPLIKANRVWNRRGFTGNGTVVAVLDTGAEYSHPMLQGKVVAGLCRSTNATGVRSLCPGGVASSNQKESGKNCTIDGCFHGTHVSSIALGSSSALRGVARGASLISGQVFSRFTRSSDCFPSPAPCVLAFFSDITAGLERVYNLRSTHAIASVNISIGGGIHSTSCNANFPATAEIINKLFKARIATVIASGNDGSNAGISAPSCIDKAIAVGSTTKGDVVSSFSNHHALVDLMAPGEAITAANLGGGFVVASGTSMATPHVAGAIALLKDARLRATVGEVLQSLQTGKRVARNGVRKRRVDALRAVDHLETLRSTATAEMN